MEFTEFWTILSVNNIVLELEQIQMFKRLEKELIYWNKHVNLISRQDEENILVRHFMHSLAILKYISLPNKARCLDFGTGGGFPGIPIKIASPEIHITLCDSIKKKIKIAEMLASHTGLRNFNFEYKRVEEIPLKKHFDFILARAVSRTKNLIDWTLPLIKPEGKFIFLKGGDLSDEINELKKHYPNLVSETIQIDFRTCDWFLKENKKILIISQKA